MNDYVETMRLLYRLGEKPQIGIFWFVPEEHEFIEDYDIFLDCGEKSTAIYPVLHETHWKYLQGRGSKKTGINKAILEKAFHEIPRGRVSRRDGRFIVWVGSWYKQHEAELSQWLEICFNLTDFEYKIADCFEIAHKGGEKELEL